ncbi:MAG TPA: inositol monophosphatase family protein [Bacteroidia bacterium]|nr:inositol monophosphatase family protein [Bacteroidia bacterium]
MDLKLICEQARDVVNDAVVFIREQSESFNSADVEYKGLNDMVSYVDKTAEKILVDGLRKVLPGSGFITEENTANSTTEQFKWIIDPLDGTTNFVHGVPCYCVSVALMDGEELVVGIIHEVNLNECFYSSKGDSAYMNGDVIQVSKRKTLSESLIVTGFPYNNFSRLKEYMEIFDFCMNNTHGIRRPGSAAVDLAYVACGRYEAFYEYGLNSWDVAAGAFIVKQAGGKVSDFTGKNEYVFGKEIIATNDSVFKEFLSVVMEKMKVA